MILRKESMTNPKRKSSSPMKWKVLGDSISVFSTRFFCTTCELCQFRKQPCSSILEIWLFWKIKKIHVPTLSFWIGKTLFVISTLFLLKEKNHFRISGILSKFRMFIDNICFLVFSNKIMKLQTFILLTTLRMQDIHNFSPCSKLLAYSEQAFLSSWSRLKCM